MSEIDRNRLSAEALVQIAGRVLADSRMIVRGTTDDVEIAHALDDRADLLEEVRALQRERKEDVARYQAAWAFVCRVAAWKNLTNEGAKALIKEARALLAARDREEVTP